VAARARQGDAPVLLGEEAGGGGQGRAVSFLFVFVCVCCVWCCDVSAVLLLCVLGACVALHLEQVAT
jgi:hypothetical protein